MTTALTPGTAAVPPRAPAASGADLHPAAAARLAGAALLAMFPLSLVAASSVQLDDLVASPGRFRVGAASFLLVALLDATVAWALHRALRAAYPAWSQLAAWFRLAYAAVLVAGVGLLLAAVDPPSAAGAAAGAGAAGMVSAFDAVWAVGLVCFGWHLLVVGGILRRSRLAPRPLGPALMVAGCAYTGATLARILLPGYHDHEALFTALVAVPALSELVLGGWLVTPSARRRFGA